MLFIDGTNFLIELFRAFNRPDFRAEKPPSNAANVSNDVILTALRELMGTRPVRHFWFASFTGNDDELLTYQERLRAGQFTPAKYKFRTPNRV
jgi:hypothetical protein